MRIVLTFAIVSLAWILFRADTTGDAATLVGQVFSPADWSLAMGKVYLLYSLFAIGVVMAHDYVQTGACQPVAALLRRDVCRDLCCIVLLLCVAWMGVFDGGPFIYFQF